MSRKLPLIHTQATSPAKYQISVDVISTEKTKTIKVTCENQTNSPWNISELFSEDPRKNWGLWNFDVIEVFWQNRQEKLNFNTTYHEWQISPNNKNFCLDIHIPRINYSTPMTCPIDFKSELENKIWSASFIIPKSFYENIPHTYIGVFAILGLPKQRSYYALNLPTTNQPNFHLPEFFLPISDLS